MPLIQLIYVSSSTVELSEQELAKILESSVRHNAEQGITGMLVYLDGSFIQALEGTEDAINETFGRIQKDTRHFDLMVLTRDPIAEREFSTWSMGFEHASLKEVCANPRYAALDHGNMSELLSDPNNGIAKSILIDFCNINLHKVATR